MRLVHFTCVHSPADVRIFVKECRSLVKAGFDISLVAPAAGPHSVDRVKLRPLAPFKNRSARMLWSTPRTLFTVLKERGNVYHFHDPELLVVGLLLKLFGKKVVYDVHEDVPRQLLTKFWIPGLIRVPVSHLFEAFENFAAGRFDAVVAATPHIAKRFPQSTTVLIQNFPIETEFIQTTRTEYSTRENRIVYVGGMTKTRGIVAMVEAMAQLRTADAVFDIAGQFQPPGLREQLEKLPGWSRVSYHGWLDRKQTAHLLSGARAGLVLLTPTATYIESLPIKMFEYMAAGLPVIASDFPLWRQIISDAGCGLLVDPLKPDAIANAIDWVFSHSAEAQAMGERGARAVREKYNWASEEKKLLSLYNRLTGCDEASR